MTEEMKVEGLHVELDSLKRKEREEYHGSVREHWKCINKPSEVKKREEKYCERFRRESGLSKAGYLMFTMYFFFHECFVCIDWCIRHILLQQVSLGVLCYIFSVYLYYQTDSLLFSEITRVFWC